MELMPGYKHSDLGVIPKDWNVRPLSQTAKRITRGASPRPIDSSIWFDASSSVGWVRISDVTRSGRYLTETTQRLSEAGIRKSRPVPSGSLIMSICATVGHPIETRIDACIHDGFVVFDQPAVHQSFLYHVLAALEPTWSKRGQTGSQMNLNTCLINSCLVLLPPTDTEQRAIALVLSDVDELLNRLNQLIAKKSDLKQAAMQQLLSGQARLPGFREEWKMKPLGDVVQIKKGQLITSTTLTQGDIPVIAGGKQPAYFHSSANRFGRTITISASGASAGYVALYNEPIFASDCSTISESGSYCLSFVYYQLLWKQKLIYKLQTGGAQPHIHAKDLNPILLTFPPLHEQTAIAEVLSDMDAELTMLELRRDKTHALKQAMMHELLTGRTRLL